MDRRHLKLVRTRCAIACVALLACPAVARAQALDTLHVRSFNMSSDTARPQVGQPFRLSISAPVADFESQFRALVEALRAEPTRPRALAVRHALRFALGAQEKETLADLVRRNAAGDRPQRITALRAIERASFCEDAAVEHNAREALPFLTL